MLKLRTEDKKLSMAALHYPHVFLLTGHPHDITALGNILIDKVSPRNKPLPTFESMADFNGFSSPVAHCIISFHLYIHLLAYTRSN